MSEFVDYYQVLEVHFLAGDEAIKSSYKRLAAKNHPDNGGSESKFLLVNKAYETLMDGMRRKVYSEEWKHKHLSVNSKFEQGFSKSVYDIAFNAVREVLNEYLYLIKNHEYESAYDLLSDDNKKGLFKKDFVKWQEMIGEVHEIIEVESVIDTFNEASHLTRFVESDYTIVTFRIRVVEFNLLLDRIEKDYFSRDVIYEEGQWKILLMNVDVKSVIKKYKKILSVHKKKKNKNVRKSLYNEKYLCKSLENEAFLNNMEYELLRYKRYQRLFSVLKVSMTGQSRTINYRMLERLLTKETRNIDAFTKYSEESYLLLLPETEASGAEIVREKLIHRAQAYGLNTIVVSTTLMNESYDSVKALIEDIM